MEDAMPNRGALRQAALLAVIMVAAGCSQDVTSPQSAARPADARVVPNQTLHGVLDVVPRNQTRVQGADEPRLVADDGTIYGLSVGDSFDALRDPASSGQALMLTGDVLSGGPRIPGAPEQWIIVNGFEFDVP
jgi:hypothetical protein